MNKEQFKMLITAIVALLCAPWAFLQNDLIMVVLTIIASFLTFYVAIFKMKDIQMASKG